MGFQDLFFGNNIEIDQRSTLGVVGLDEVLQGFYASFFMKEMAIYVQLQGG